FDIDRGIEDLGGEAFDVSAGDPRRAEPGGDLHGVKLAWQHALEGCDVGPVAVVGRRCGSSGSELVADVARQVLGGWDETAGVGLVVDEVAESRAGRGRVDAEELADAVGGDLAGLVET